MTVLASRDRAGPAGALRWLADAYARYAHLVLDQLKALDDGDLDRVASLAAQRDALAAEIDGRSDLERPLGPAADRLLAEVRHNLLRATEADRSLRRRLRDLRAESKDAIDEAARTADRTAAIGRSYAPPTAPGGRIDVSF
jgi:hypothetical protein